MDRAQDATLNFDVIAYRGSPVATFDGWRKDASSRGGVIAQVPGGFFQGIKAARFGDRVPYVYELPPIWLLVADGVDTATLEFLDWVDFQGIAEDNYNQAKAIADIVGGAGKVAGAAVSGLPSALKWAAIGLLAVGGIQLVQTLGARAPRANPPRRRRRRRQSRRPSG